MRIKPSGVKMCKLNGEGRQTAIFTLSEKKFWTNSGMVDVVSHKKSSGKCNCVLARSHYCEEFLRGGKSSLSGVVLGDCL